MKNLKFKLKAISKPFLRRAKNLGRKEILVLGDSHAKILSIKSARIPGYYFNCHKVKGATISGLKNPNSVSRAIPIFRSAIKSYKGNICIILLGEVDTGFVIWYRAEKYGISVKDALDNAVLNYIKFIRSIPRDKHIICISAPLPTIQDGQNWGEISNLRKEVKATQKERTILTVSLNKKMEDLSINGGFFYINLDTISMGPNGLVKKELLHKNKNNHHYDPIAYLNILMPKIKDIVEQIGTSDAVTRHT